MRQNRADFDSIRDFFWFFLCFSVSCGKLSNDQVARVTSTKLAESLLFVSFAPFATFANIDPPKPRQVLLSKLIASYTPLYSTLLQPHQTSSNKSSIHIFLQNISSPSVLSYTPIYLPIFPLSLLPLIYIYTPPPSHPLPLLRAFSY